MKKETIVSAKTVEEALALAAKELNAPVEALDYTVLEEAKRDFSVLVLLLLRFR